jgi:hypothetical protein
MLCYIWEGRGVRIIFILLTSLLIDIQQHKSLQSEIINTKCIIMFGKAKCKLCGDNVRFILKHLKEKHPETLNDKDVIQLKMSRIMEKYFV